MAGASDGLARSVSQMRLDRDEVTHLLREGAERHAPGDEALQDGLDGLDFIQRDWLTVRGRLEHIADRGGWRAVHLLLVELVEVEALVRQLDPVENRLTTVIN